MPIKDIYKNDIERVQALQSILVSVATGQSYNFKDYETLRSTLINNPRCSDLLPTFVRTCRGADQFWPIIKGMFSTYLERKTYIWQQFTPLLDHLEGGKQTPLDTSTSEVLKKFDTESVHAAWQRALNRRSVDAEGAITAARSLLETVCKHILDSQGVAYDESGIELHELYKLTASELRMHPHQHVEQVFRQILGGCSAVVNGLGVLRNRLGDAHGKGKVSAKPAPRHAELAVNLSGALSLFLVSTFNERNNP